MVEITDFTEKNLNKLKIDDLTHLFMDIINEQTQKLIEGIKYLINEDFENFKKNLAYVIETRTELTVKKTFETKIFKSKLIFSKADRLKVFDKINDLLL